MFFSERLKGRGFLGRQRGFGMLEVMGSLVIGSLITVGVVTQTQMYTDSLKDSATADQLRLYGQAGRVYLKTQKDTLLGGMTDGQVMAVEATSLQDYLPSGFANTIENPYGHRPCLLVKREGSSLKGMLVTQHPNNQVRYQIPPERQRFISVMAGLGAGYIEGNATYGTSATGPGWTQPLADWQARCANSIRTNYSLAVSLDLYNPDDEQDCRYLSAGQPDRPNCGTQMTRDLEFAPASSGTSNSIRNLSAIYPDSGTLQVKGAANVDGILAIRSSTGAASGTVRIGGATVTGDTSGTLRTSGAFEAGGALVPGLYASIGQLCTTQSVGAIARAASGTQDGMAFPAGGLLSCQEKSGRKVWQPVVSDAREEVVVGCGYYNAYCLFTWAQALADSSAGWRCNGWWWFRNCIYFAGNTDLFPLRDYLAVSGGSVRKLTSDPIGIPSQDAVNKRVHSWEVDLGERTYCALGKYDFNTAAQTIPAGINVGCEVKTAGTRNNRPLWVLTASVTHKDYNFWGDLWAFFTFEDMDTYGVTCRATCIR